LSASAAWREASLAEIAQLVGGGTPRRDDPTNFGHRIDWVTPSDLPSIGEVAPLGHAPLGHVREGLSERGLSNSSARELPPGTVLFSSRASIGKIAVADRPCCTNQGFTNFIPKSGVVHSWFLAFLLASKTPDIASLAGETTFKEVSRSKLAGFRVALPAIEEQRRIVSRIKECMERIDELEAIRISALDEAKQLFRAQSGDVFGLDWPRIELRELLRTKPTNGLFKRRSDFGEGVLLANVRNLYQDQVIHPGELERVRATADEIARHALQSGDVLVNRSSLKREGTGRVCLFVGHDEPVVFECHIMRVRLDERRLMPYLFTSFMNSRHGFAQIMQRAKTATMTTWNQAELQTLQIPVPPREVQDGLVETLEQIRVLSVSLTEELESPERKLLRAAVLKRAFAGEI
jgi:type I restriction enzyme, S subunit